MSLIDQSDAPVLLRGLADVQAGLAAGRRLPPVDSWNPDFCGDIDMAIARNGEWFYMGTPIRRPAMVRLFSTILRRDEDGRFYLVTPVEKVGIRVEDAPFVAVTVDATGEGRNQSLAFRTNVGDDVIAGRDHPIRVETNAATGEPRPYVHVRGRLEALIARAPFYELVGWSEERVDGGVRRLGVWSAGTFFPLGTA